MELLDREEGHLSTPTNVSAVEGRALEERLNARWNVDLPQLEEVRPLTIPGQKALQAEDVEAVLLRPANASRGVVLFVHGGGWAFCSLRTHDRFMRLLAVESRTTVLGIHYRLAPENPFPAGLNDIVSAYRTIIAAPARFSLDSGPVVLAGDSAGGNLILGLLLHEIAASRPLPAGVITLYPVLSADFDSFSYKRYGEGFGLTSRDMRTFWDWYVPNVADRVNPLASPLMASDSALVALPPLFLLAADLDPLADDTYAFKARLERIGRSDELLVGCGMVHGFLQMTAALKSARAATKTVAQAARQFIASAQV